MYLNKDAMHDAMYLNKDLQQTKQAHNIKDPAVYVNSGMGYFLSLFSPNPSCGFAAKSSFFYFI